MPFSRATVVVHACLRFLLVPVDTKRFNYAQIRPVHGCPIEQVEIYCGLDV